MKVGVMSRGSPDYLIDIVADGVVRLLGRESVALDYNTKTSWSHRYAHLFSMLQGEDCFPLRDADVLIASLRSASPALDWAKVTQKKVAILDGEDDADVRPWLVDRAAVYFKREFFGGRSYHWKVKPLQFAAVPEMTADVARVPGSVFFHAEMRHSMRIFVANVLQEMGLCRSGDVVVKEDYNKGLLSAMIGISTRGAGWDTYRYWETTYFGACLLTQRLPLVIPGNFVEGEVVFFDGERDFKPKLLSLLSDPERAFSIGAAGKKACLERHMSVNRAKTVLEALA